MHVLKSRWLACAALAAISISIVGCQIDSGSKLTDDLQYVKIAPGVNLRPAPEGYVYELWALGLDVNIIDDTIFIPNLIGPYSVVRFQWDPYLYAAKGEDGEFLPITIGNGMPLRPETDINAVFGAQNPVAFITVEPANETGAQLAQASGPTLVAFNLNAQSHQATMLSPFELVPLFTGGIPSGSYHLLSQSNKSTDPNANWRDNETEGQGIWFANPRLTDKTDVDSVLDVWDAYLKSVIPDDSSDAYLYAVWKHRVYPESSFSNFGLVMPQREPDFEFRNGSPTHVPGKYGPSDLVFRTPPLPPIPGVQLGSNPVVINGQVVGYRYIVPSDQGWVDTCIVRVDDPTLTRCNRDRRLEFDSTLVGEVWVVDTTVVDTFPVSSFDEVSQLPTAYRITNGDTSMGPTLIGVLDLSDIDALNEATGGNAFIFAGWEYEAWVIFTEASGIPPLSLGRFKSVTGFDSGNPYTFTDSRYDHNFDFPGEDFLQGAALAAHHPSLTAPLDVIHNPNVEKLWITIEPDDDFGYDWAPDAPNTQLIYLSAFLPNDLDTVQSALLPLVYRDLNPNPSGLNGGNFFPSVTVQFLPALTE